jgi:hypothetical protein
MSVELIDFSIQVTEELEDAVIAALYEAAGELQASAVRNSRQGHKYGDVEARALWEYKVDEDKLSAAVGSQHEAGYWEEFGTGEFAQHGDGRKGWWVYVEGQDSGKGGKSYSTKEEAEEAAKFLKKVKKLDAYATNGIDPNRPLHRAFKSSEKAVEAIFAEKLKGMG